MRRPYRVPGGPETIFHTGGLRYKTGHLLVFGTEQQVERSVKETIEQAAPGGGYILSSSNSIHPGCRPENYIAMVRAAHRYGAI